MPSMLRLCGFASSNYYNKVKFALLEKGVEFEEALVWPSDDAVFLGYSPLGKIPYLVTPQGVMTESQAILEYVESRFPKPALLPADPFLAAKVREMVCIADLYLEWEARRLYREAFFGGNVSAEIKELVRP